MYEQDEFTTITAKCPMCDHPAQIHGPLRIPFERVLNGLVCENCKLGRAEAIERYKIMMWERYGKKVEHE